MDNCPTPFVRLAACMMLLFSGILSAYAQQSKHAALIKQLSRAKSAPDSLTLVRELAKTSPSDSVIYYLKLATTISERLRPSSDWIVATMELGYHYRTIGNYLEAVVNGQRAIRESEKIKDTLRLLEAHRLMIFCYADMGDSINRIYYTRKSLELYELGFINRIKDSVERRRNEFVFHNYKAAVLLSMGLSDSSIYHVKLNLEMARKLKDNNWIGISAISMATRVTGYEQLALLQESWPASVEAGRFDNAGRALLLISEFYQRNRNIDSALRYANLAYRAGTTGGLTNLQMNAFRQLFKLYKPVDKDSALLYLEKWSFLNDSIYGKEEMNRIQGLNISERSRVEAEANSRLINEQRKSSNNRFLFLLATSLLLLAIAAFYFQSNRTRKKSHQKLELAYKELESTQAQLIQSEKMASLGELTAGIAHEIQNPLNFVNNFSEVNKELLEELKEELEKGNVMDAKALANDVILNEEKILFHGKRADGIVKGMLQHSRSNSGTKEVTDINALCDEYLRLAYHGLRAKDKSFNARFEMLPDTTIGEIKIIPQDMGRVVLNLINNAFYAVSAKRKLQLEGYEPAVTISTRNLGDRVEIAVADNGTGIPQKAMEKIFQPFFTTKPAGEGTGLGLSLSYDIVTKAHGGELKVETTEGKGTTFIITLPKQQA